jgi:predicted kinase
MLVVVTGPPASGKSGLARDLATELRIPFISKDELKERLYEVVGSGDPVEDEIEAAALAILFSVARSNLDAGVSVLVESNFDARSDTQPFRELDARIVQIHCGGEVDELVESFAERSASGRRHPGHDDSPSDAEEVRRKIESGFWDPLDIPAELIRVDREADAHDLAMRLR